jgi:putative nucleotidyltransferase with HDIG domain
MTLLESKSRQHEFNAVPKPGSQWDCVRQALELCFSTSFAIVDATRGEVQFPGTIEHTDESADPSEWCQAVLERGRPEFIAEHDPVVVLALPITGMADRYVAMAPFVVEKADEATIAKSLTALGYCAAGAGKWSANPTVSDPKRLLHLAELQVEKWSADERLHRLQRENSDLSSHLSATYEELSLLYGLTQKLKISASIEELGRKALEWLAEAVAAEGLLLELLPHANSLDEPGASPPRESLFLPFGDCPLDRFRFHRLIEYLNLDQQTQPQLINSSKTDDFDWPARDVRQAVIVPLTEGENLFGWLAAINHQQNREFGSSEANLLSSVATILGIHAGNLELYREQADFLAGVVRALTSAIDAKDPYTCGHSDRVARIAVRLADRMGLTAADLETVYLSGLLHDIGKIGIDDQVLRKPGRLTESEYEHIKLHAEIGYRILKDLKQLGQVLPAVRHHHESWNGTGYPFGLNGTEIPLFARIIAVADAFDAMSSDRPYRKGMPDEKLDEIFRAGAGRQWDTDVVDAFFAARDEIRQIGCSEHEPQMTEMALLT